MKDYDALTRELGDLYVRVGILTKSHTITHLFDQNHDRKPKREIIDKSIKGSERVMRVRHARVKYKRELWEWLVCERDRLRVVINALESYPEPNKRIKEDVIYV